MGAANAKFVHKYSRVKVRVIMYLAHHTPGPQHPEAEWIPTLLPRIGSGSLYLPQRPHPLRAEAADFRSGEPNT